MTTHKGLPVLAFADRQAFEAWLNANAESSDGVWLKLAKSGAGVACLGKTAAIEAALCFGWVDGQLAPFDDRFWLIRFTRRGLRSRWSRINREKAESLIEAGAMKAPGLAEVERARRDGRWDAAYASQSRIEAPQDFLQALERRPAAKEFFATLSSANRYAVLYRLHHARPAARAARLEELVEMLACRRSFHPAPPKKAGKAGGERRSGDAGVLNSRNMR